jgi:hypothetical protein
MEGKMIEAPGVERWKVEILGQEATWKEVKCQVDQKLKIVDCESRFLAN